MMQTLHPALLIGPYDWDAEMLPQGEFDDRLAAVRRVMAARGWRGLIVHGDSPDYAALTYLTGFVPKLGPALALVALHGAPRLVVSGAPTMMESAQRLTWLDDLHPLRNAATAITDWLDELPETDAPSGLGLWGAGAMRPALHETVTQAGAARGTVEDAGQALDGLLQTKRPLERGLMRQSCRVLGQAIDAIGDAHRGGAGAVTATLDGEDAARRSGAQDVRTLFSLDGGQTLQPFEDLNVERCDPLVVYVAVKAAGYWSEGMVTLTETPGPAQRKAGEALRTIIAAARVGATGRAICDMIERQVPRRAWHPVTANGAGCGIGLSLREPPLLVSDGRAAMVENGVYSLRVGISDATDGHALLSAMVAVTADGNEVLWSAAP